MQQTLAAMGVHAANGAEYALVRLGDHPGAACLDPVQWTTWSTRRPSD